MIFIIPNVFDISQHKTIQTLKQMESKRVNKLEKYLKHRCISQRGFAKKIGTTPNNLSLLVRGKSTPTIRLAYKIEINTGGLVSLYDWLSPEDLENKEEEDEFKSNSTINLRKDKSIKKDE